MHDIYKLGNAIVTELDNKIVVRAIYDIRNYYGSWNSALLQNAILKIYYDKNGLYSYTVIEGDKVNARYVRYKTTESEAKDIGLYFDEIRDVTLSSFRRIPILKKNKWYEYKNKEFFVLRTSLPLVMKYRGYITDIQDKVKTPQ